MSYAVGELAARTIITTYAPTYFDTANTVSVANNTPAGYQHLLDRGSAQQYCFLRRGPFTTSRPAFGVVDTTWQTIIELWVRYVEPSTSEQRLATVLQDVLDALYRHKCLNNTASVRYSDVLGGDEELQMINRKQTRLYVMQNIRLEWLEEQAPSFV